MNIEETLAPSSDQLDAIELVAGPRTFVIERVSRGSAEQPVDVHLVGFPRVWRPSKGMRRVLAAGWGVDASVWAGRSVTLYYEPEVMFGREKTGGTRISHMSDLPGNKRLSVPLLVSRGKSAMFTVEPLREAPVKGSAKLAQNSADRPTHERLRELGDAFAAALITDGADKARFLTETLSRDVAGWGDLTDDDVTAVIGALREITGGKS